MATALILGRQSAARLSSNAAAAASGAAGRTMGECGDSDSAAKRAIAFTRQLPELPQHHRRVYLMRHGETDWNRRGLVQGGGFDIPLNDTGRDQARRLSEELSRIPLDVVASSHLARARQTADAIRAAHPSTVAFVRSEFGEMRFGSYEGVSLRNNLNVTKDQAEEFRSINSSMVRDVDLRWPGGGESTREAEQRSRAALDELLDKVHPESRHVAVVAHGRLNKILLSSLLFGDVSLSRSIKQDNTCINVVDLNVPDGTWSSVLLNYVDHTDDN